MIVFPYKMESVVTRIPYSNAFLITFISIFSFFAWYGIIPLDDIRSLILKDWDLQQLIGNTFLHANFYHLLGNMIFLWVFGSAVCAAVGNVSYIFLYIFLAIIASAMHMIFDGRPVIGASGAINGLVGMTLFFFPINKLHCWYFIWIKAGRFKIRVYWMILLWFVFDIVGIITGGGEVAYWAHLGGFVFGILMGLIFVQLNIIELYDPTLIDVITGRKLERETYDIEDLKTLEAERAKKAAKAVADEKKREAEGAKSTQREKVLQESIKNDPKLVAFYSSHKSDPIPEFRVLSMVRKNGYTILFIVNDGDPVEQISVQTQAYGKVDLQPEKLDKKAAGWMRLMTEDTNALKDLRLSVSYKGAVSFLIEKTMLFDETHKKFVVI